MTIVSTEGFVVAGGPGIPVLLLAQLNAESAELGLPVLAASLILVVIAIGFGLWLRLGITRDVVAAALRAAVQLLAVGFILTTLFESSRASLAAAGWVLVMVGVATFVIGRRVAAPSRGLYFVAGASVAVATVLSLVVVFATGVLPVGPVAMVVMAGITIGNAMPAAVLGVKRAMAEHRSRRGEVEALLSLGLNRSQVVRFMAPGPARDALIPQIERTKVVGLIALPGAMTGLLLAGVDPVDAVLIQIVVMYLVLGATALCAVVTVAAVSRSAITDYLVMAPWVAEEQSN